MSFRPYQQEAFDAIKLELESNHKCLVKMFCGTGKSLIMKSIVAHFKEKLSVFVFPSLCLTDQFYEEYLGSSNDVLKISSDSTTDVAVISKYLLKKINKVICITYQSFKLLLDNLQDNKIDVCCFDEAHHAVGHTYKKLIFNDDNLITKEIFFTATPKNANGIVMYDKSDLSKSMCGKLVYDYSYYTGVIEGYLNLFDIEVPLSTENTNKSIYESIARSILRTGNDRVLTFHTTVNSDVDSSIKNFVDENLFIKTFKSVVSSEFPSKKGLYKKITMIGLDATISMMNRKKILKNFKKSENSDSELNITILCSCETIGEGIDTSDANMCVFVDPKSSVVKIIQNIGRIVRKQFGVDKPNSTVLIPICIDKLKYENCSSVEDRDKAIREDMSKGGDFCGILNVLSALKQEQEDLFDACITYHNSYSQTEIDTNFANQGYKIDEVVGDGGLIETIEYIIDKEVECDDIGDISVNENICIEIYNDLIEEPVSKYNEDCDGDVVRLYKTGNDDENKDVYQPIIKKNGEKKGSKKEKVKTIDKNKRPTIIFQCNSDVKVLWSIKNWGDCLNSILLECEVLDVWDENLSWVDEFIVTNKRRPSVASKDNKEKVAGKWLSNNTQKYKSRTEGMKQKERYDKFSKFLEDNKQYLLSSDETYNTNIDKLKGFIDTNKRLPLSRSKDKDERYLSNWYQNVMYNYRNKLKGMINEGCRDIWGIFVEDNKQYVGDIESISVYSDKFYTTVDELRLFFDTNKRRPSSKSNDRDESRLGNFLRKKTYNFKNRTCGIKNEEWRDIWGKLVEKYKEYLLSDVEKWFIDLENLKEFIDTNNRKPSSLSKEPKEKFLNKWLSRQNHDYSNKGNVMKCESHYTIWTAFLNEYKEYFMSVDEKWNAKFARVKEFVKINNRKPSEKSKENDEKGLGYWTNDLTINFENRTGGMNNEERRDIWSKYVEDNKQCFRSYDKEMKSKPIKSMKLKNPQQVSEEIIEEPIEIRKIRTKSQMAVLHQRYKTLSSATLNKEFGDDSNLFIEYHNLSEKNEELYPREEIPRNMIIKELEKETTKRKRTVVDMGCGRAQISKHFTDKNDARFQFINYDHVSSNESVISCDISNTPLDNDSVDIAVLCLAMWGSNCKSYITEAHRILESNGLLYIIEPTKRWSDKDENNNLVVGDEGGRLEKLLTDNYFQVSESKIKKFSYFVCNKRQRISE